MSELHPLERTLLQALRDGVKSFKELEESTGLPEASISRAALWLASKGYIQIKEVRKSFVSLGPEGRRFSKGLPERVLAETMSKKGKLLLSYAQRRSTLSRDDFTLAIGWARRKGWIRIAKEGGRTYLVPTGRIDEGPDETLLKHLSQGPIAIDQNIAKLLKSPSFTRPNIVSISEEVERSVELTPTGRSLSERGELPRESVSQLTPELLLSGRWKEVELRRYDIHAPVTPVWPGKKHPYRQFLDNVKWKLVAMGFKEMVGPAVELMFFNCDTLYMPQDHPAREIHDIYFVKKPRMGNLKEYSARLVNVKEVHEGGGKTGSIGWGYRFSIPESRRFILRSQGTAISARTLLSRDLEIPGKYFSVARIFRPDVVDRTHLTEFNQIEGIVLGEELTFRELLGVLETFAREVAGAEKVRFRPDYFPFTEPSVELAAYKEGAGWLEFGGAGIFRPEVTEPLGVKVPVIAWGLGMDRLFMMRNNIDDIRYLFSQDLEWLRSQRVS